MTAFFRRIIKLIIDNWEAVAIIVVLTILFVIVCFLFSKIRAKLMQKVVYRRSFSDKGAYEGEVVTMTEMAYNPTPFPLFFVNIEGYIYNGIPMEEYTVDPRKSMQYYVSRFHLMPFMQIRRRHSIRCAKRGYYKLETAGVCYGKKVHYLNAPADIYVYPKIVPLGDIHEPASNLQGDSFTRRWLIRDPFTLSGVREYQFGDPFNTINFKATARSGSTNISAFKVNNRDFCSSRTFMVYLNFQTDTDLPINTVAYEMMMERGLSYASAIIREAAYNGYKAGFAANCCIVSGEDKIRFPVESGQTHLEEILREMAKVRCRVGISVHSMLEQDIKNGINDTEIYVITPYVNELMDGQLMQFRRMNNTVNILQLQDEESIRVAKEEAARAAAKEKIEQERLEKERQETVAAKRAKEEAEQSEAGRKARAEQAEKDRIAREERAKALRERQAAREALNKNENEGNKKGGG